MKPIPYGRQHIDEKDIAAVIETLQSDYLTQGPKVAEFEEAFAKYVGAQFAIAVSNGTAALHLAGIALNVQKGQKVLTSPITFAATANAMLYSGAEVDFVDIHPETYTIDLDLLEQKLATAPKGTYAGVLPIDFAGFPVDMERLRKMANNYNLWIIEDACHAPGAYFTDSMGEQVKCGSGVYSDLTVFSFHPVKHIACGEGGMITTNDEKLYQQLCDLRTHGITRDPDRMRENHGGWYHEMHILGYNYRLPDLNCALGITQLAKADEGMKRRQEIASRYAAAFKDHPNIRVQTRSEERFNAYHLFVIRVPKRKEFYDYMREHQIYCQIHYLPCHLHPYYQDLGWKRGDLHVAEKYYEECITLPIFPSLTDDEQNYVIEKTLNFFA